MRFYKLEQWFRIPEKEQVILNQSYFVGKHRFVIRTRNVSASHAQVRDMLYHMPRNTWDSFNVGSGYTWEPQSRASYFLAVSMQDELTAMQFELTYC